MAINLEVLRTICMYCRAVVRDGPTDEHGNSSHSVCPDCMGRLEADLTGAAAERCRFLAETGLIYLANPDIPASADPRGRLRRVWMVWRGKGKRRTVTA